MDGKNLTWQLLQTSATLAHSEKTLGPLTSTTETRRGRGRNMMRSNPHETH